MDSVRLPMVQPDAAQGLFQHGSGLLQDARRLRQEWRRPEMQVLDRQVQDGLEDERCSGGVLLSAGVVQMQGWDAKANKTLGNQRNVLPNRCKIDHK